MCTSRANEALSFFFSSAVGSGVVCDRGWLGGQLFLSGGNANMRGTADLGGI